MALQQCRINEIYPNRKPFAEASMDGAKRKACAAKDLRVQAMLGAQEAAKRQCVDGVVLQEQQPPAQEDTGVQQRQDGHTPAATDFSGFFNQLHKEKQQQQLRDPGSILQESSPPQQQRQQQQGLFSDIPPLQQQEHAQDSLGGNHEQQQRQHSAVSTLDQLLNDHDLGTSRHKSPERELKHVVSLDRMFGDTSRDGFIRSCQQDPLTGSQACNRSNSSAATGAAAAAAAAAAREQHSWHLTGLPQVPWDWSVKSSVRLSSAQTFNVLEQQLQDDQQGLQCMCQAVAAAAGGTSAAAAAGTQERLQQALMQWQHPAAPLAPAQLSCLSSSANGSTSAAAAAAAPPAGQAVAAVSAAAGAGAAAGERARSDPVSLLLRERVQQWREALRAGYIALRHGHCPVVYICGQAFKQPFTAVLCAPGVIGPTDGSSSGRFTAVLSRSNRQLRSHLATFGCEGSVAGQLEQQVAAAVAAGKQQGLSRGNQQQQQLSAGAFDGQPGSQLLLVGVQHVHGLYAALLALPWCEPGQPDVPLLSAPVPFLHAQLCPLRLVALPDALLDQQQQRQQQQTAAAAGGGGPAVPLPLHYVELRTTSSIMPWTLHRLLGLVRDTQGLEGFQAYFGTEPCSSSLNVLPELWTAAAAEAAGSRGGGPAGSGGGLGRQQQQQWQQGGGRGLSEAEAGGWADSAVRLHGRVLRQLKVDEQDGSIAAKLA